MKSIWISVGAVVLIWGAFLGGFFCLMHPWPTIQHPNWDLPMPGYFAAVNALFSALAFGAVFWNLWNQRVDRLQSRFALLLTVYNAAVRDVKWNGLEGIDALVGLENTLLGEVDAQGNLNPQKRGKYLGKLQTDTRQDDAEVQAQLESFFELEAGAPMAHLFRMQYQLIHMVSDAVKSKIVNRKRASEILDVYQSGLSDPELHLMLYYGISKRAPKGYLELIGDYGLLNGLMLKEKPFILYRIPEIKKYPKTYQLRTWKD
jgi:hypothetical protein